MAAFMQTLTEADVLRQLDPARLIAALEHAFRDRYRRVVLPPRTQLDLASGVFLIMPCADARGRALGTKFVMVPNLPGAALSATYVLFDVATAAPRLALPANTLTDLRTAATSALATKYLAREDARTLAIFGTGREARSHLRLVPVVRNFERVLICGSSPERSRAFAEEMGPAFAGTIAPADARTCAVEADVLCTCTNAHEPVFEGERLRPGTHINAIGSFQPHKREVDDATIRRAAVYLETYDVLAEAGDLILPMEKGILRREEIRADLHQLLSGAALGRQSREEITFFKSVGCALEDLVAAELLET
jgi:ornithine cyclodeaminase/alanine dehydrogenase-like protein (mu-crystallin family)